MYRPGTGPVPHGGRPDRPSLSATTGLETIALLLEAGANPNAQLKLRPPYRNVSQDRLADPAIDYGATPLLRAAKAHAVLSGRSYLTPDDIRAVAAYVLAHRLVVSTELEDEAGLRANIIAAAVRDVRYRRSVRPV